MSYWADLLMRTFQGVLLGGVLLMIASIATEYVVEEWRHTWWTERITLVWVGVIAGFLWLIGGAFLVLPAMVWVKILIEG